MPTIQDNEGHILVISGRCGMSYTDPSGQQYFVSGEMLGSGEYDFVIYSSDIYPKEEYMQAHNSLLTEQKEQIAKKVIELGKQGNIKIKLFP